MPMIKKRIFVLIIYFFLSISPFVQESTGQEPSTLDPQWQSLESGRNIIQYKSLEELESFDHGINFRAVSWHLKRLYSGPAASGPNVYLKEKIDAIFERVQGILDMRKKMKKVIIKIYSNKEKLDRAYYTQTKKNHTFRAWYIFEENSISVNVQDINEGILAHEMAHAIIDHFFDIRPPRAAAEILARYVDKHLNDQQKP